ncbi:MAG: hypothetical protein A3G24_10495 [Betaproteobacteria bacterium RIFCSPLOWO2_12_FULL_62_13]|nr:MAG: hypothetical protein A3G24_10495 [Betaproteobacteria bacterium RIFCSPLOWO2_12_FULL_62_13]
MTSKLTIRKWALIVTSTAMAGAIHSGAQAAEKLDCSSGLTQIAIMSEQGSEGGISRLYEHCVAGAQQVVPTFIATAERAGVAGTQAVGATQSEPGAAMQSDPWPAQDYRGID